jgi:proteasome component ECM29
MALADNASVKNELQTALSDLSSLGRVSHRLAMIDNSSKLQSVLDKLLARLLERFGANYQKQATVSGEGDRMLTDTLKKIHQKLVETLSHAMKRARDDRDVKLNCDSILTLMLEPIDKEGGIPKALPTVNPFTLNLSLAFLALGIPRCSETELKLLLPDLIILHGFYASRAIDNSSVTSRSHWHQFSHLLLTSLDLIMEYHEREQEKASKKLKLSNSTTTATPSRLLSTITASDKSSDSEFNDNSNKTYMDEIYRVLTKDLVAAAALYDLMLDGLLYQSTTGGVPPPGCSQAGQERLQSNKPWMAEMAPPARLSLCKARLLDWIAPSLQTCLFPTDEARTCTLLLAASGDGGSQVSHQAGLYLKQYLELKQERKDTSTAHNFLDLIIELLILCVGSNNALLALSGSTLPSLGLDHFQSAQRSMPFRRRMVSDSTFAVMMTQVDKAFANEPHLFDEEPDQFKIMHQVGTLTILASSKMLVKLRTSTGLTALRGKPYVSAARAMNSLVVRFLSTLEGGKKDQNFDENSLNQIGSLLAKALSLTFTSLSNTVIGSSSSVNSVTSNEGNLSIRDALYGIICELSRSASLVSGPYSWLFAMGKDQDLSLPSKIDTATLLFRCLAKEEQSLLPRTTAALDAVLAAYCRAISKKNHPQMPSPNMNPWITAESEIMPMTNDEDSVSQAKLAKSLLPLLWGASQYAQSKPSRLAAARWSSELLTQLDLTNACHLLCFLSGDKDVTVVSIAMQGLCLGDKTQSSQQILGDHESEKEDGAETMTELGNFSRLTSLLFSATSQERPRFWEFRPKAKASSIAYLLKCLMNDFYGCEDEALYSYMDATTKSLVEVSNFAKGYIELLDTCATSLAACVSTSLFARKLLFGSEAKHLSLGLQDMEELTLNVPSSCARRALADACGSIYGDMSLWTDDEWLSSIVRAMELSLNSLEASAGGRPGSVHGAAFLGGTCVKQYRLNSKFATSESGWKLACQILDALGRGTTVSDDIVGKGFTDALSVTLSYRKGSGADAPRLDARLQEGATSALSGLASALRKYSSDEYTDVSRTSKVAHSMGVCLEATIPYNDENKNENDRLHTVRLQCIESLLALLGSAAYRKDEEIALGAGEALAAYAWVPKGLKYSSESNEWPNEMDTDFALTLPPHQQVSPNVIQRIYNCARETLNQSVCCDYFF